jgi:hypothetical protein
LIQGVARRRWVANGLLGLGVVLCAVLVIYPPERVGFYPVCPIYEYLHFECPGCEATRALAALLRGHVAEAMRLNALFVVLLPFALAGGVECYRRAVRVGEFCWPEAPGVAVYGALGAAAVFTVVRNLVG